MAAPILSKNKKAACLTKAVEKSNVRKTKNVLCGEHVKWPRPSKEVEDSILLKLSETLKALPNIFKHVSSSSKEDVEAKRKVRVQLDLGTNCVCRSLERDRLAGVLVSGKVTPASAVDPLVMVARDRGCPLLFLDSLSTTLAKVTKTKSFPICIGFKKLVDCSRADFIEVIDLIKENTTVHKNISAIKKALKEGKKQKMRTQLPDSMRPVSLDTSTDEAVSEDLKRIFTSASFKEAQNKMATSKDKKRKKNKQRKANLKQFYRKYLHNQFESGKNTVTEFVGRGKLRLVFVIPELIPVLMSEPPTSSLLCVARDQDCPVLCVSNLSKVMCADTEKALAVLGIKKESCLPMNSQSAFNPVIEKCLNFMRSAPMPEQEMDMHDEDISQDMAKETEDNAEPSKEEEDYSFLYVLKKDSTELKERALKLKEEQDKTSKQLTFNSDFISFSDVTSSADTEISATVLGKRKSDKPLIAAARLKPKRMLLDKRGIVKNVQPQANISGDALGFISLGGSQEKSKEASTEKMSIETEKMSIEQVDHPMFSINRKGEYQKPAVVGNGDATESDSSTFQTSSSSNILGLDSEMMSVKDEESQHMSNIFSVTAKKGKGEDKKRHGQEGFVSLNYTEANIHTMVTNSDRKKKKKKGKK